MLDRPQIDPERLHGPTFAPPDVCFFDFESRSSVPIEDGAYAYAMRADAIVLAYAIGAGPAEVWHASGNALNWKDAPKALRDHAARVARGEAIWAAWNTAFDKAIWNYSTDGFPVLDCRDAIDVMAQAVASGLAADLKMAAKQSKSPHKDESGKELIKLFCSPGSSATPQSHPAQWEMFLRYAGGDVEALRGIFMGTLQLPLAEWREYWAMERINERGVCIDLPMVTHAAQLAEQDRARSAAELRQITGGEVTSVDQVKRMVEWLLPRLPVEGRDLLTAREEERDDDGELVKPAKYKMTRRQVERLIVMVEAHPTIGTNAMLQGALRLLQLRLYGGSKTPQKFGKMARSHVDGVLYGQYVFNGASQTGRASSRGVQVHNLARDALEHEHDMIEALIAGAPYAEFAKVGGEQDPVARKLSLLIRPAFVPTPHAERAFVWSDWSQIEARVVPWLADYMKGARERLQIFRDVDADPSIPDLYTRTAATLSRIPIEEVTKPIRQRGKVAELALGFLGGVGALQAMAAGYRLHLSNEDAKQIVERWREANPWVMNFGRDLWDTMRLAIAAPNKMHPVGRLGFMFRPGYLGGTLFMKLPSERMLVYRQLRREMVDELDDDGRLVERREQLRFSRGYGRISLWPGILVENATQAVAADVLRGTLVRLEEQAMQVRLHTHDEVLIECSEENAPHMTDRLQYIMRQGFSWSAGLPLMSEETTGWYYTKNEGNHGL